MKGVYTEMSGVHRYAQVLSEGHRLCAAHHAAALAQPERAEEREDLAERVRIHVQGETAIALRRSLGH